MVVRNTQFRIVASLAGLSALALAAALLVGMPAAIAAEDSMGADSSQAEGRLASLSDPVSPAAPAAPCPGGPTIDGVTLTDCVVESFTVGGENKSVTVWYTTTANVQGHWVNTDAEAQDVATWGREAWESYHTTFGRHPYDVGCSDNINVQLEDGPCGAIGCAYWASPGNCWIGIDAPTIRGGGGQLTVYHEFQHYLQYAFDDGCYDDFHDHYQSGAPAGNAEYFEGYADVASDSVDATADGWYYGGVVAAYNPLGSFFDKSYFDVYSKYYLEQLGSLWTPTETRHHMDAVRDHYAECDAQDTIYVLDTLIPTLSGGDRTQESLFLDFFAANWAKDWADPGTQPELVYTDDDSVAYGQIPLSHDVNIAGGSQTWNGETTPDDWAGRYYQVRPQAGCDYVTVEVDGAAGSRLGINLMAADSTAPTSVSRSGWIGQDFSRTFAGHGVHDHVAASVNAFASTSSYDISFTCVTPVIDLLEPKPRPNHTQVGDPASPIAFLARFKVTSAGVPVRGLPESSFTAQAEGDAVTFVPGSFQEVGEEYWAIMTPPTKAAGTQYVDVEMCLDSTVCDKHIDALLYVDPGKSDFAMVFDASGSMDREEVAGEGKRYENAQKAGTVIADLLREDDRILVMDFSAKDEPASPGDTCPPDCKLDLQTYLPRTKVVVPTTIDQAKDAIDMISPRDWTPIGAALQDAKNKLQASPYSLNPKTIVLLSDGQENVNPMYSAVRTELKNSGVIINTIAFSSEADEALMAQIAADTGGISRFVPTTPGTRVGLSAQHVNQLQDLGVSPQVISELAAGWLPGPLGLDNVYDYYETIGQGASRLFNVNHTAVPDSSWRTRYQYADDSVNTLRLVVAGKQEDALGCAGYHREVEILPPGGNPRSDWVPVSPPDPYEFPPANWDIRNSRYDDVVIITNPAPGMWGIRTRYFYLICKAGQVDEQAMAVVPLQEVMSDFIMNASVQSDFRLHGRFLPPIVDNQGMAGDTVPIVATLLSRSGAVPGAQVVGTIEKPGTTDAVVFHDDGVHSDGEPGDGVYGALYGATDVGGTYNVRLVAEWEDPAAPGNDLSREWLGAFWIRGPESIDGDRDGMPDPWEERCDLDTKRNDSEEDPDRDGLVNIEELHEGTLPCDPDTDDGGEQDGSEVWGGRNPLEPADDLCKPLGRVTLRPLNEAIRINWPRPDDFSSMRLHLATRPGELGELMSLEPTGEYQLTGLTNDETYYLTLAGVKDYPEAALCDYSETVPVTPKEDPVPPYGWVLINGGAETTLSKEVVLDLSATNEPVEGVATPFGIQTKGPIQRTIKEVNEDIEMRISNDPSFSGAVWEPFAPEKPWTLGETPGNIGTVHAQYRDAAGNESAIVVDNIRLVTALRVAPMVSTLGISDTITVDVMVSNVEDLYGVEFSMVFDPDLVQVEDAIPGGNVNIIPGDFLQPGADVHQNYANNATGEIEYTQTRSGAVPGVDGSGVVARITFHGKAEGTSELAFTLHILGDPFSVPIDHEYVDGEIVVSSAVGTVQGKVILERRVNYPNANAGVTVRLASQSLVTGDNGSYSFSGVPAGTHHISATHPSYLPTWRSVDVTAGATTTLPDVTMLGGDCGAALPQGEIYGEDHVAVNLAWGTSPGDPDWNPRADIRDDNVIDVLDLTAVKFNWLKAAPGFWPGSAAQVARPQLSQPSLTSQAAAQATMVISPTVITASIGSPATVDVWVQDVDDLYGGGFQLDFNPSVIKVQDANPFEEGVQIELGSWLERQQEAANSVDNATGEIDYFVSQSRPATAKDGSGILARMTFVGVANGSSDLQFTRQQLVDDEETIISATTQDGQVLVAGGARIYLPLVLRGS